jgi:HlyD family secretion protein
MIFLPGRETIRRRLNWKKYTASEVRQIQQPLKIQGNVDIRQVNLRFRVSGRIREMRFEEGDPVRAGDLIALLDEGPYQDQVTLAKAQLAQSRANLTKAINGSRPQEIDQAS